MLSGLRNLVRAGWGRFMRAIGAVPPPKPPMSPANRAVAQWAGSEAAGGAQVMQREIAGQVAKQGRDPSFWRGRGSTLLSIGVGIAIGLAFPGIGFAGQLVLSELGSRGVEGAIGVMSGPAAEPTPAPPPPEEEGPAVTGQVGSGDPGIQEQPSGPEVIIIQGTPPPDDHDDVDVQTGTSSSSSSSSGTTGDDGHDDGGCHPGDC